MARTLIKDLRQEIGEPVKVFAWITARRNQGKIAFFEFRDMSGTVQGVVIPTESDLSPADIQQIKPQSAVKLLAQVNKRPEKNVNSKVQNGDIELQIQNIEIL